MKHIAIIALLSLTQVGCATLGQKQAIKSPLDYPMPDVTPTPVVDEDGGFTYSGGSLYSRRRARAVGDLLKVKCIDCKINALFSLLNSQQEGVYQTRRCVLIRQGEHQGEGALLLTLGKALLQLLNVGVAASGEDQSEAA